MAARIIAQLLVATSQVVIKAFAEAYRQAIVNASRGGGARAAESAAAGAVLRRQAMSLDEAAKILNVDQSASYDQVGKNFTHLFMANDKSVNGSFYLQSKVVRAKERFEIEWKDKKMFTDKPAIPLPQVAREAAKDGAAAAKGGAAAPPPQE